MPVTESAATFRRSIHRPSELSIAIRMAALSCDSAVVAWGLSTSIPASRTKEAVTRKKIRRINTTSSIGVTSIVLSSAVSFSFHANLRMWGYLLVGTERCVIEKVFGLRFSSTAQPGQQQRGHQPSQTDLHHRSSGQGCPGNYICHIPGSYGTLAGKHI